MMFGRIHQLRFLRRISALAPPTLSPLSAPPNPFSVVPARTLLRPFAALPCIPSLRRMRAPRPFRRARFCTIPAPVEASSDSTYLSVRIRCLKRDADMLSEALLCFGANSASMDELSDFHDVDEIWITCIFAEYKDVDACISHSVTSIGLGCVPKYEVSAGENCNWVKEVQETFHPIEVTDGLWIVPKWREPPDLQATNIILDPGMAFGTGEHPTTRLCLMLLNKLLHGGETFLDYGTGSGVLGIAALKMGAFSSVGIDIDPQAIVSAHRNIALNDIDSSKMSVYLIPSRTSPSDCDAEINRNRECRTLVDRELESSKGKFDTVIANILLNPLVELAEDIVSYGKPGANIALSGVLSEQAQRIKEIFSRYLDNISVSEMEGWACIHGTKREESRL